VTVVQETDTLASYTGSRSDVVGMLARTPGRLLDIGCSNGALARYFTDAGVETWGIELDPTFGAQAAEVLTHVLVGDAQTMTARLVGTHEQFDAVICADVLEHTFDPWSIMRDVRRLIAPEGEVIVSLPNVRFFTTFIWLGLRGRWRYEDRGVHDRTHVRWFTDRNARDMFSDAGFEVTAVQAHYRLTDQPNTWLNRHAGLITRLPRWTREFFSYQYVYSLRPVRSLGSD
jgi:2-polyprenyl-3-methyl-5-hydroxy-6-metoxy-1,4-benzoquinol methylase